MTAPLDIEALRALLAKLSTPVHSEDAADDYWQARDDLAVALFDDQPARPAALPALLDELQRARECEATYRTVIDAAEELARIRAASPDVEAIRERVALVSPWIGNPEVIDATMVGAVVGQALAESVADFHAHAPVDVRTLLAALDAKAAEAEREKVLRERAQDALRREGIGAVMAERDEARRELAEARAEIERLRGAK